MTCERLVEGPSAVQKRTYIICLISAVHFNKRIYSPEDVVRSQSLSFASEGTRLTCDRTP